MIDIDRRLERYVLPSVDTREVPQEAIGITLVYATPYRRETGYIWTVTTPRKDEGVLHSIPFVPRIEGESFDETLNRGIISVFGEALAPQTRASFFRPLRPDTRTIQVGENGHVQHVSYAVGYYMDGRNKCLSEAMQEEYGSWVEPTRFYDSTFADALSPRIIEDLFVSGVYTDVIPLYRSQQHLPPRNDGHIFMRKKSMLD